MVVLVVGGREEWTEGQLHHGVFLSNQGLLDDFGFGEAPSCAASQLALLGQMGDLSIP